MTKAGAADIHITVTIIDFMNNFAVVLTTQASNSNVHRLSK